MVHARRKGLELLDRLKQISPREPIAWTLSSTSLELAGDRKRAVIHYRAAAEKTASLPERNYLLTQAAQLSSELGTNDKNETKQLCVGDNHVWL